MERRPSAVATPASHASCMERGESPAISRVKHVSCPQKVRQKEETDVSGTPPPPLKSAAVCSVCMRDQDSPWQQEWYGCAKPPSKIPASARWEQRPEAPLCT